MKLRTFAAQAALAAVVAIGASGAAFAQSSDCKTLIKPSPFGPDDQTGASNRVTDAVTKAAAAEIKTGEKVSMTNVLVDGIPLYGTRFSKDILTATSLVPGAQIGENKLTYMEDTWISQSHVGTHFDGLGHIGIMDCYYNQTPMGKYVTQNGLKKLGLENLKSFATRGVIIDLVRVFKEAGKLKKNPNCKGDCLDGGTIITAADLQAGLKMYNVTLREGDAVFLNTGWEDLFLQFPAMNAVYNGSEPGLIRLRPSGSPRRRLCSLAPTPGRWKSSQAKALLWHSRFTSTCLLTTAFTSSKMCAPTSSPRRHRRTVEQPSS